MGLGLFGSLIEDFLAVILYYNMLYMASAKNFFSFKPLCP